MSPTRFLELRALVRDQARLDYGLSGCLEPMTAVASELVEELERRAMARAAERDRKETTMNDHPAISAIDQCVNPTERRLMAALTPTWQTTRTTAERAGIIQTVAWAGLSDLHRRGLIERGSRGLRGGIALWRAREVSLPDQPPPTPSTGDVWAELIAAAGPTHPALVPLMEERRRLGIERYGQPLQRGDHRDHRIDAMQEMADGSAYSWSVGWEDFAARALALWDEMRERMNKEDGR